MERKKSDLHACTRLISGIRLFRSREEIGRFVRYGTGDRPAGMKTNNYYFGQGTKKWFVCGPRGIAHSEKNVMYNRIFVIK